MDPVRSLARAKGASPQEDLGGATSYGMDKISSFLKDVKIELSKVSWPTKDQTVKYTLVVLVLSFAIAIFLGAWDWVLQLILNKFVIK